MKKVKVELIKLGEPNANNRVYRKGLELPKDPVLVTLGDSPEGSAGVNMENVVGQAENFKEENDVITADITLFKDDVPKGLSIVPSGTGNVELQEDGTHLIKNYKWVSCSVTNTPSFDNIDNKIK